MSDKPRLLDKNLKAIAKRIDKLEIDIIAITQSLGAIHKVMVIMKDKIEVQELR